MELGLFGLRRPSSARALGVTLALALVASALAFVAMRVSTFGTRSHLALAGDELGELYLTPLAEDPARALLTSRRENSTWTRDRSAQAGDPYWVRRYADPARPGLPERILLTSRSRGAHLLVPLAALDLEQALAERTDEEAPPGKQRLGVSLAQVYWGRAYAGVFLHLRFPERELVSAGPEVGEPLERDLLVVRGNQLVTTDFLLQPNGELYRDALADGLMPAGPYRRNAATGDELVLSICADPEAPGVPLYSPIALLPELELCWGQELGKVVDDRWRLDLAPAYALRPASAAARARVAWHGAVHLAARFEPAGERAALAGSLQRFGSPPRSGRGSQDGS